MLIYLFSIAGCIVFLKVSNSFHTVLLIDFSFFVPPEENNACQQVFNQGWSLTVSALNFSNS